MSNESDNERPKSALEISLSEMQKRISLPKSVAAQIAAESNSFGAAAKALSERFGPNEHLSSALRGIANQQKSLAEMARLPTAAHDQFLEASIKNANLSFPEIPHIENPAYETNRKLEQIQNQFAQISEVARSSAQVATDLQAYAAEFLQKFEKAADDANQSGTKAVKAGNRAIILGIISLAVSIFIGIAPLFLQNTDLEETREILKGIDTNLSEILKEEKSQTESSRSQSKVDSEDTVTTEKPTLAPPIKYPLGSGASGARR